MELPNAEKELESHRTDKQGCESLCYKVIAIVARPDILSREETEKKEDGEVLAILAGTEDAPTCNDENSEEVAMWL
jgi:hypothetical protein